MASFEATFEAKSHPITYAQGSLIKSGNGYAEGAGRIPILTKLKCGAHDSRAQPVSDELWCHPTSDIKSIICVIAAYHPGITTKAVIRDKVVVLVADGMVTIGKINQR